MKNKRRGLARRIKIEVCERAMDYYYVPMIEEGRVVYRPKPKYHAQIKGKPGLWGCGNSVNEAAGDLVRSHPDQFGVEISRLGRQAR